LIAERNLPRRLTDDELEIVVSLAEAAVEAKRKKSAPQVILTPTNFSFALPDNATQSSTTSSVSSTISAETKTSSTVTAAAAAAAAAAATTLPVAAPKAPAGFSFSLKSTPTPVVDNNKMKASFDTPITPTPFAIIAESKTSLSSTSTPALTSKDTNSGTNTDATLSSSSSSSSSSTTSSVVAAPSFAFTTPLLPPPSTLASAFASSTSDDDLLTSVTATPIAYNPFALNHKERAAAKEKATQELAAKQPNTNAFGNGVAISSSSSSSLSFAGLASTDAATSSSTSSSSNSNIGGFAQFATATSKDAPTTIAAFTETKIWGASITSAAPKFAFGATSTPSSGGSFGTSDAATTTSAFGSFGSSSSWLGGSSSTSTTSLFGSPSTGSAFGSLASSSSSSSGTSGLSFGSLGTSSFSFDTSSYGGKVVPSLPQLRLDAKASTLWIEDTDTNSSTSTSSSSNSNGKTYRLLPFLLPIFVAAEKIGLPELVTHHLPFQPLCAFLLQYSC
jgi:hypothetical protein